MSVRDWVNIGILLAGALAFVVVVALWLGGIEGSYREDQARSALTNCEQIELIKGEIRNSVRESVKRLPTISYYQEHPDELVLALRDSKASAARFDPDDCYALPVVKASGLTRPAKK